MPRERRQLRQVYGFEDVAIAPGQITVNPEMVDFSMSFDSVKLEIPFLASAMDAVVSPSFAVKMSAMGGLGVLNLDGIQTRYEDPEPLFTEIAEAAREDATELLQRVYAEPVKEQLIAKRIEEIGGAGATCAVSVTPANTKRFAPIAEEAGADVLVVQSTVTTTRHASRSLRGLIVSELVEQLRIPVLVGNTVSYEVSLQLMEAGVHGILVGVGPGAACTSREVLGIGVPQVTATLDCAAARDAYLRSSGRYVPIITDGGIRTGGDVCKAFACGADAVMIGTPLAQAAEAPGLGYNWGMSTPHSSLPRGTRISVGTRGTLEQILFGPSSLTDGTQNLVGALRISMGMVGARNIEEMHRAEVVHAPSIKTEGKVFQTLGTHS